MVLNVMVVDDNALMRLNLRKLFESDGFHASVAEATNGPDAIRLARELKPNLITLDFSMPGMSGFQAAPFLREILPDTPIILVTLYGDMLKHLDLKAHGISSVFLKTDPLDNLLRKAFELVGIDPRHND